MVHGVPITDPFGWLDEAALDDPKVIRLITEFKAASDRIMGPLASFTGQLRADAVAAVPPPSAPAPVPDSEFGYCSDWSQGCRQLWRVHLASGVRQLLFDSGTWYR